jgi:IPT/TIG domain-containing protein
VGIVILSDMAFRIHEVSPTQGWPGTIVEIRGEGFDPHRDSNTVIVGNRPALVLRASPERLLVMAAEGARTGEIRVESGRTWMLYDTTDANGEFSPSTAEAGITLDPGRYTVQVLTGGSPNAAETESEIREVILES